jgi:hypothetical protein
MNLYFLLKSLSRVIALSCTYIKWFKFNLRITCIKKEKKKITNRFVQNNVKNKTKSHNIHGPVVHEICPFIKVFYTFGYGFKTCGEWPYLFATNVANGTMLLDFAVLNSDYIHSIKWRSQFVFLLIGIQLEQRNDFWKVRRNN